MMRPEKTFWFYVATLSSVLLLGLGGQHVSCASAHPGGANREHFSHHSQPEQGHEHAAPWNHPEAAVSSAPGITMKAQLDRGAILQHGEGIVRVEVELQSSPEDSSTTRQPSDVVVVVDTSGSMGGQKLHIAKEALSELFDRLDPRDRFGLVEYSDTARVLVPLQRATESNKANFRFSASHLVASGSTNMSDGIDHALNMLRRRGSGYRPGRVLLLSDGLANAGDDSFQGLTTRASQASASGLALTTMGVGEDFDENLMTSLATSGAGAFYYIAKLSFLPEFFDAELASARGTYASSAELNFRAASGVQLLDAMGLPILHRGQTSSVQVGNIYAGRSRSLWLTLKLPAHTTGSKAIGDLNLRYRRNNEANNVSVGTLPAIVCLTDEALYHKRINRSVWERALLNDVFNRTQEEFGDAIRTGDREQLHSTLRRAEVQRRTAQQIGSSAVIHKLDELKKEAKEAEKAQAAPAPTRNRAAKANKSRGYQQRNKGAFDSSARYDMAF